MTASLTEVSRFMLTISMLVVLTGCTSTKPGTNHADAPKLKADLILQPDEVIMLNLRLFNCTSSDIKIRSGRLPWETYGMTLVLVETDPFSTVLRTPPIISDPIPGAPTLLRKGEEIKGTIELTDRFPQLSSTLKVTEVIVFWSYQLETAMGEKLERIAGWKVLNQLRTK